jgi:hypothetical protein
MLLVALGVVLLTLVLDVRSDECVTFRFLNDYPLPETCLFHSLTGARCPACGLSRSLIYLAHADWRNSLRMHSLGWLMALAVLLQFPYRLFSLACGEGPTWVTVCARGFGYFLIVMLIGNWALEIVLAAS